MQDFPGKKVVYWTRDRFKSIVISANSLFTPEEEIQELSGTQVFGDLTCGNHYPGIRCVGSIHDTTVVATMMTAPLSEVAENIEAFLEAWE